MTHWFLNLMTLIKYTFQKVNAKETENSLTKYI